jgi:hypothetical protein
VGIILRITLLLLTLRRMFMALETNSGKDWRAALMGSAAGVPANFVGLTANVTAPAVGDTTLTGEIATAGGGLIRKQGTYAHTAGTASYTITTTFTANGTDALPVTVGKRGVFTAVTAGTMAYEALVSPTATLSASGDQLTLTDTFNI